MVNNMTSPSATVAKDGEKTIIHVEISSPEDQPVLHVAPDTEMEELRRKMTREHNDRYGEPLMPGGIMSASQEKGDEAIPTPAGGVISVAGQLNHAVEVQKLEQAREASKETAKGQKDQEDR